MESLNNNLYERLVGAISKISTSCKPHEELEIYETFMKFYSNEPLMQKQMGFNEFITDTIDADMLIKNPPLTSDKINSTYMVSSFYPEYEFTEPLLQIRALSCLVNLLKSMVQWSHKSIIEIEGPATIEESEDSSCRDTVVSTETPSETPTASTENIGSTKLNPTSDDPDQFEQIQYEKQALRKCVELFNQKPKRGIKKLIENNFIPNDSPLEIAKFLLQSEDLDKVMIGEYLGEGEAHNITTMHNFVDLLEFTNLDFVSALRKFLRTFRLPGEAQKIDRFMLKFAERYVEGNPGVFANADTAYVLGYSVILLNTDLHNPQIKRRMTKDDFIKNNRGINDNGDLPNELLEEIYDEIQKNEIKMKDEPVPQQNQEATPATGLGQFDLLGNRQKKESAMNRALQKSSQIEKYLKQLLSHKGQREDANGMSIFYTASHWQHIRPMFELVWMACLAGVSGPIQKCNHPRVVKLCLNGFRCAVRISGIFDISLARNAFITALCNFCFLANISEMKSKNLEAIKVTLEIAGNDGNYLKDSWNDVLSVVNNLVRLQIVPNYNATDGTLSEKTRRASSSSTPSFALTHNANLAASDRPRATGAQVSEATMETTNSQQTLIAIDKIFSNSVNLSGSAIVDFLDALCVIAISGIQSLPQNGNIGKTLLNSRMFALQKVVEIAYYNMNRIRIEWLNIWNVLGNLFNQAGCHPSETVSSFALDSLRQLSMNFLEKDELPRFRFQKEFLKPFAYIIANNRDNSIKDLVLRCLQQMIKTHGENVKSGWITMMEVFSLASKDPTEEIYKFSFELMQELFEASYVNVSNLPGSFSSYLTTLAAFANYTRSQKLSLSAMELYKGIVDEYISLTVQEPNNPALSTYAIGIEKVTGKVWLEDYPYYAFWIPVFEGYLEVILNAKDIEVRTRAIDQLFQYLQNQGQEFPGGFWYYLMQEVLMKMFGDVNSQTKQHGIHSFTKEELDMWVSTTLVEALRRFVALFTDYFDSLFPFIDGLLDLLAACLCQEDTTLSKLGASCFQQLVENNVHKLNHEHWEKLISIVIRLFNASRLDIPVPQSDLTLSLTGCNADDINDLERRIIDDSIPIPLSPKNDQHRQSLCLLMLSLIEDLFLQHDLVFDNVDPNYLFIILSGVESTYHQTQTVNGRFDLKDAVNRDAIYEITKFAKTSLNQELSCISSLMKILLRMYDSDNEIYKRFHNKVEERLIP
jgi:brefeldin A-inhibited guanine nucleotide-exchange protein